MIIIMIITSECSQLAQKEYKTMQDWLTGEEDPPGIVQEIKIQPN